MDKIDRAILAEVRIVKNDPSIQNKEVMEWSTGAIKPHEGEEILQLPRLGVNVALKLRVKKVKSP